LERRNLFGLVLGGVVEKLFFCDLISFPALVSDLLHLRNGAVQPDKAEFPTYDNAIAINKDRPHAFRRHAFRPGNNSLFASDEVVATLLGSA
jgi:hypothetical protein